jgi:serine/threonine protein kinase
MPSHLTCPEGHQWDEPSDQHRLAPERHPTCPVCGMGGAFLPPTPPTFRLGAAVPAPLSGRGPFSRAPFGAFPAGGPPPVPGYEILGELGHGGMGVVYKARQTALNRLVALKMILPARASADDLERFRREARAVAALQHPNIIQIHEVGDCHGLPYFSLEFAAGGNLADRLTGKPQPPAACAALVETLARAIHYAHEHGFVHRDLKPSNILLSTPSPPSAPLTPLPPSPTEGRGGSQNASLPFSPGWERGPGGEGLLPKIGDFGLVRRFGTARGEATLTQADEMLGTPAYMAPEQVRGRSRDLGPAVDVYALGVILYEMLTGRPPFDAGEPFETMRLVLEQEPVPPRALQPKVPPDLETICLKCLEKEPPRRYPSALGLAEDLRRFQAGEPIVARPTPAWERAWKWVRRRPALAGLSAAVVLVTVLAFAGISAALVRAHAEWQRAEGKARDEAAARLVAEQHEQQANEQRLLALRERADAVLDVGINLCDRGNVGNGLLWLAQALKLADEGKDPALQRVARINLASWSERHVRPAAFLPHNEWVWAGAFSPDGKTVVTGSRDRTARLWDVRTGQPLGETLTHEHPVWAVAFHPEGKLVLTGCGSADGKLGAVRLWDARTGKPVTPPLPQPAQVGDVRFGPDGQSFLVVCANFVQVYRTAAVVAGPPEAARPLSLGHANAPVLAAAFSPDGGTILTGTGLFPLDPKTGARVPAGGGAHLWDTRTGRPVGAALPHPAVVDAVAFSPDGKKFATGSWEGTARLWQTETRQPLGQPLPHRGAVKAVVFSPDGRLLAAGGMVVGKNARTQAAEITGGEARLWDVTTGQALGGPLGHHRLPRHPDAALAAGRPGRVGPATPGTRQPDDVVNLQPGRPNRPAGWHGGACASAALRHEYRQAGTVLDAPARRQRGRLQPRRPARPDRQRRHDRTVVGRGHGQAGDAAAAARDRSGGRRLRPGRPVGRHRGQRGRAAAVGRRHRQATVAAAASPGVCLGAGLPAGFVGGGERQRQQAGDAVGSAAAAGGGRGPRPDLDGGAHGRDDRRAASHPEAGEGGPGKAAAAPGGHGRRADRRLAGRRLPAGGGRTKECQRRLTLQYIHVHYS